MARWLSRDLRYFEVQSFFVILIDVSVTCHCPVQTGVQRVTRCLYRELSQIAEVTPVTFDPYAACWRTLDEVELQTLTAPEAPRSNRRRRRAYWNWSQRLRGWRNRNTGEPRKLVGDFSALIVPEIFSAEIAAQHPTLFAHVTGPKVALFHDIIPLQLKELTPAQSVARFPDYLNELCHFDHIVTNSQNTARDLLAHWKGLAATHPPVEAIPLAGREAHTASTPIAGNQAFARILSVGTLEGRKNHLTLLNAAEQLWAQGSEFSLTLVGMVNRETGTTALQRIRELEEQGRAIRWLGPVSDDTLKQAYQNADFTVYPSLAEGFGLPVLESLAMGRPCLCGDTGALAEVAQGGGCFSVDVSSQHALSEGLQTLIADEGLRLRLAAEANARDIKSWAGYAGEILECIKCLPVGTTLAKGCLQN